MKIAFIIENAFYYGGTENVCNFMCEVYSPGNIVDILSLTGEGKPFYPYHGARDVISLSQQPSSRRTLIKKIVAEHYDNIYIIGMGRLSVEFALLGALFLPRSLRKTTKFIACEHVSFKSLSKFKQLMKQVTFPFYNNVVVLTEREANHLASYHQQVLKISNPVFFKNFNKTSFNRIAIAVGRLSHEKGFDRLIKIWRQFSLNHPEWKLFIIGSGDMEHQLNRQAADLIAQGNLVMTGRQNNLDEFYQNADIILMTSYYEGLPLVLLEAKSWSLPAIAYDCPAGPREIIEHTIDGFLIPDNEQDKFVSALNNVANFPEVLQNLRGNICATHKKFDPEMIRKQWLTLLD